jgi:hypothetical protein
MPGGAVVDPGTLEGRDMERVQLRAILGAQRDVEPSAHRLAVGLDDERGSSPSSLPNAADAPRTP